MTVQTTTSRADYTGNGVTTAFTVPFYFLDNTHLRVLKTQISTGAITTLALTTDYTVTGAGVGSGGTMTFVTAPTADQKISILRNVPLTQLSHYVPNDPFPAATHEQIVDQLTMEMQQLDELAGRALTLPANTVAGSVSAALPTPAASKVLGWDGTGASLVNYSTTDLGANIAIVDWQTITFSGTGSQTVFTLGRDPGVASNCDVTISGVTQRAGIDFTVAGTTLTFVSAPPAGTNNIAVRYGTLFAQGTVNDGSVYPVKLSTGGPIWDSSGNFGIGMTPSVKLDVNGSARLGAAATLSNSSSYMNVQAAGELVLTGGSSSPVSFRVNGSGSNSMTLNASGNLGIGTASPVANLHVNTTVGNTVIHMTGALGATASNGMSLIVGAGGDASIYQRENNYLRFGTNNTERMRIDSAGNVGIGITAPGAKLSVGGAADDLWATGADALAINGRTPPNGISVISTYLDNSSLRIGSGASQKTGLLITGQTSASGSTVQFSTGGSERMRIDASGNLGVGVTPSAWASSLKVIETSGGAIYSDTTGISVAQNAYYDGTWKYKTTAAASKYGASAGAYQWFVAASGTIDTAITWTTAMTLNASGQLGIGTTSPTAKLTSYGTTGDLAAFDSSGTNTGAAGTGASVVFNGGDGTTLGRGWARIGGFKENSTVGDTASYMPFSTRPSGGVITERMRIDSVGNVGIGTTTPAKPLDVVSEATAATALRIRGRSADGIGSMEFTSNDGATQYGYIQTRPTGPELRIVGNTTTFVSTYTNGLERMRVDSSGNVLVTGAGGLGYGTGSGGAVTQITSRTTGVTLNKTNGAITLVSAAGSATYQSFTVTNSTVAATDTVVVSQKSGTDLYITQVTAVAAGSFRISFATTGGTTTEQPVFSFAVVKAVTA